MSLGDTESVDIVFTGAWGWEFGVYGAVLAREFRRGFKRMVLVLV